MPGPDDQIAPTPAAPASPVATPSPAPVTESQAATEQQPSPVAAPDQPSATAVAPAAESPAPSTSSAAGDDSPKAPTTEPTLLEAFDAAEKAKTEGEKPTTEAKPEEKPGEKPAEAAPEAPKLDPIDYFKDVKLPESLSMSDTDRTEFSTALDQFRADPSKGTQGLIDLHNKAMSAYAESVNRKQWETFADTKKGWRTEVMADPQIGGAGHQTAMRAIADVRDKFISTAKPGTPQYETDRKAFENFLAVTGAGDHPVFLRMLHNVSRFSREASLPPADPAPPPTNGRGKPKSKFDIYNNPSSQRAFGRDGAA